MSGKKSAEPPPPPPPLREEEEESPPAGRIGKETREMHLNEDGKKRKKKNQYRDTAGRKRRRRNWLAVTSKCAMSFPIKGSKVGAPTSDTAD